MSTQTSLLSLPDELLVRIVGKLANRRRRYNIKNLLLCATVCSRLGRIAQAALFERIDVDAHGGCFEKLANTLGRKTSLGQLVTDYSVHLWRLSGGGAVAGFDQALARAKFAKAASAAFRSLSNLQTLALFDATSSQIDIILSHLGSRRLRAVQVTIVPMPQEREIWPRIWAHFAEHSSLHSLMFQLADIFEEVPALSKDCIPDFRPMPQVRQLCTSTQSWQVAFGSAVAIRKLFPNLEDLSVVVVHRNDTAWFSAQLADLSDGPQSLTVWSTLRTSVPQDYLKDLPATVRHLCLGRNSFVEAELLAYLPTSPLRSLHFMFGTEGVDRILQLLTGPTRPRSLRRIVLDHAKLPLSLENELCYDLDNEGRGEAYGEEILSSLRRRWRSAWPPGCTADKTRAAIAAAKAFGIAVEGSAVEVLEYDAIFERELFQSMMRDAKSTDNYEKVFERFGEPAAIAWLWEKAPNTVRLARAI
ncbi:hypothetical protein JCM10908_006257 [Rhodotorula pacifica]|uniref:uncharacterized protein n=1 Tax=Rhodotorula pacifica TaxID=1495444 RepID=UPI00317BC351